MYLFVATKTKSQASTKKSNSKDQGKMVGISCGNDLETSNLFKLWESNNILYELLENTIAV